MTQHQVCTCRCSPLAGECPVHPLVEIVARIPTNGVRDRVAGLLLKMIDSEPAHQDRATDTGGETPT